jgi:hypothetical protein
VKEYLWIRKEPSMKVGDLLEIRRVDLRGETLTITITFLKHGRSYDRGLGHATVNGHEVLAWWQMEHNHPATGGVDGDLHEYRMGVMTPTVTEQPKQGYRH